MRVTRIWMLPFAIAVGCGTSSTGPGVDASATNDGASDDGASGDGGAGVPYGPCTQCGSLRCESFTFSGGGVTWCAPPCDVTLKGADCPKAPDGATATPMCVEHSAGVYVCALACGSASGACPAAMKCANGNRYCGY